VTVQILGLGTQELLIILAIVLLLFGGARLAGLGKSTGRAIREFKEETKSVKAGETPPAGEPGTTKPAEPTDPETPPRTLS
jgi:sec-independent protein translocase protein TatA